MTFFSEDVAQVNPRKKQKEREMVSRTVDADLEQTLCC